MFIQLRVVTIFLFLSFCVVTFTGHVTAREFKTNQDKCSPKEGLVRIGITGSGKAWFFEWSADGLKLIEKQKQEFSTVGIAPPGVVYAGEWDEKAAGIPQDFLGAGFRLDAPFAVSFDGQLLVTTVYPARGELFLSPSSKLALIDRKGKCLIVSFDAWCNVESVAWSPSGKHFAVLLNQNVTKEVWKGPLDWWGKFIGHPITYHTLYAAMYDLQGKLLCEKRIMEKLSIGRGFLVWEVVKNQKE